MSGVWNPVHPSFTFMDVKLVVIPAAPPVIQVQLHWIVEIPFLRNFLHFLPQEAGPAGSEAQDLAASCSLPPHTRSYPFPFRLPL